MKNYKIKFSNLISALQSFRCELAVNWDNRIWAMVFLFFAILIFNFVFITVEILNSEIAVHSVLFNTTIINQFKHYNSSNTSDKKVDSTENVSKSNSTLEDKSGSTSENAIGGSNISEFKILKIIKNLLTLKLITKIQIRHYLQISCLIIPFYYLIIYTFTPLYLSNYTTFNNLLTLKPLLISTITHYLQILTVSILTHFIFLKLINYNLLGVKLNAWFNKDLKNNLNKYTFYYFVIIVILSLILKHNINILHLEEIIVQTKIGDIDVTINGNYLNYIFDNLGDAAVFGFGSRLSYAIIAKAKINTAAKIGITISSGITYFSGYKIIKNLTYNPSIMPDPNITATITLKNVSLNTTTNYTLSQHPYLDLFLGTNPSTYINNADLKIRRSHLNGFKIISSEIDLSNSPILSRVIKINPDFLKNTLENEFLKKSINKQSNLNIWSPLEENPDLISWLTSVLKDILVLESAGIYLLLMLGIIFICKLLSKNLEFKFISNITFLKWPIGSYIKKFLNWYINLWQKSSNFWIFFIIFTLLFSNCITTYSLIRILLKLKDLSGHN